MIRCALDRCPEVSAPKSRSRPSGGSGKISLRHAGKPDAHTELQGRATAGFESQCFRARPHSPTAGNVSELCQQLDEWRRRKLRRLSLKQYKHPKGIRRFLESIGCKQKLWSGIASMGRRWWRIACSEPANICMDKCVAASRGIHLVLSTPQTPIGNRRMP